MTSTPLAVRQAERFPVAVARAEQKMALQLQDGGHLALLRASTKASNAVQRVHWLQRAASAWTQPLAPVAACRKGCNHCCRMPVTISHIEAELITRATGRKRAVPGVSVKLQDLQDTDDLASAKASLQTAKIGTPCPFLVDEVCSIYSARPLACRLLLSLDDDDLLCQHADDGPASVPYVDVRKFQAVALAAQPSAELADIREFFPVAQTVEAL